MKKQIPTHTTKQLTPKKHKYAVCIPIINEGQKIQKQLQRMKDEHISEIADIIILDGGSTDGSVELEFLREMQVSTLLTKTGSGKLSAQLRMGYSYLLEQGYEGCVTVDGNGKDNVEAIPSFLKELEEGYDFVQGSRFIEGGQAINTPISRYLAVRLIHVPVISVLAGFGYTDTTNGYRGISAKLLSDEQINIFREVFDSYELLFYMSVQAAQKKYRVRELPVTRAYPLKGKTPTKISFQAQFQILEMLARLTLGHYDLKE